MRYLSLLFLPVTLSQSWDTYCTYTCHYTCNNGYRNQYSERCLSAATSTIVSIFDTCENGNGPNARSTSCRWLGVRAQRSSSRRIAPADRCRRRAASAAAHWKPSAAATQ